MIEITQHREKCEQVSPDSLQMTSPWLASSRLLVFAEIRSSSLLISFVWIGIELFTNVERRGVYEHKWDSRQPLKHAGAIVCAQICCDLKPGH
ncbi:hypothetical protein P5673_014118 [Acropora cervicornis]|uniref:Uncharacterized protein n=1 Tax=Acropora cervicornis TaxID=6130 RepID=A0AAD9V5Y8_ACRCE|nr:hypothetical protein P5673_014118 [Acropora cervicornis]